MLNRHKNLNGLDIHAPISFVYANENERTSAGGFDESDINKLAKQESDNSVWMLVNNAPTTWTSVGKDGDVVGPASATSGAVVTFNGTTGKLVSNSSKTLPGGAVVGTTDTQTLTNKTMNLGSNAVTVDGTNEVGFKNIPRAYNNQAATWTLANAGKFAGKTTTTARTMTIPSNSSVPFPIGTALTFTNTASSGNMTIAITTDTMYLAGEGTTGTRTLEPWGVATAIKVDTTVWMISGTGLI